MDRTDSLKAKALPALQRLAGGADDGHAVALAVEEIRDVLAYVRELEKALPSVRPTSDLEVRCEACGGAGGDCEDCDGVGTVPTEAGQKVIGLIGRRLKPG